MNSDKTVFALNWKEDKMKVNEFSKILLATSRIYNRQDDVIMEEALRRTSSRQNKATTTRSKDFLWQK
jgi:hypothetical protein